MKVTIYLDVSQSSQYALVETTQCGNAKIEPWALAEGFLRYEITVDVPHPTDVTFLPAEVKELPAEVTP